MPIDVTVPPAKPVPYSREDYSARRIKQLAGKLGTFVFFAYVFLCALGGVAGLGVGILVRDGSMPIFVIGGAIIGAGFAYFIGIACRLLGELSDCIVSIREEQERLAKATKSEGVK